MTGLTFSECELWLASARRRRRGLDWLSQALCVAPSLLAGVASESLASAAHSYTSLCVCGMSLALGCPLGPSCRSLTVNSRQHGRGTRPRASRLPCVASSMQAEAARSDFELKVVDGRFSGIEV